MGQHADRVHTDAQSIEHLTQLVNDLPGGAKLRLTLLDGSQVTGMVSLRPALEVFRDRLGTEGINAVLRLQGDGVASNGGYVWLDRIGSIEHL